MTSLADAAIVLDIPIEMARRHGLPSHLPQSEIDALNENPPAWLAQSRANRTGKKPVWVTLNCTICGFTEAARPKKWWPEFTYLLCHTHDAALLPAPSPQSAARSFTYGVGTQFTGATDSTD